MLKLTGWVWAKGEKRRCWKEVTSGPLSASSLTSPPARPLQPRLGREGSGERQGCEMENGPLDSSKPGGSELRASWQGNSWSAQAPQGGGLSQQWSVEPEAFTESTESDFYLRVCVWERERDRQTGREHRVLFTLGEEYVCVWERERERRRERDKGRESKGEEGGGAGGMATVIQEGGWLRIFSLSQFLCVFLPSFPYHLDVLFWYGLQSWTRLSDWTTTIPAYQVLTQMLSVTVKQF